MRVVDVETGGTHEIADLEGLEEPWLLAWSSDGSSLLLSESVGRRELWVNRDILGG